MGNKNTQHIVHLPKKIIEAPTHFKTSINMIYPLKQKVKANNHTKSGRKYAQYLSILTKLNLNLVASFKIYMQMGVIF